MLTGDGHQVFPAAGAQAPSPLCTCSCSVGKRLVPTGARIPDATPWHSSWVDPWLVVPLGRLVLHRRAVVVVLVHPHSLGGSPPGVESAGNARVGSACMEATRRWLVLWWPILSVRWPPGLTVQSLAASGGRGRVVFNP